MQAYASFAGPSPRQSNAARPLPSAGASPAFHPYQSPKPRLPAQITFINATTTAAGGFDGPGQVKQKRKRIMPEQLEHLCELFDRTDSPTYDMREQVAVKVGMTNREVQVWFQNRRAKVARQQAAEMPPPPPRMEPAKAPSVVKPSPVTSYTSRFAAASEGYLPSEGGQWKGRSYAADGHPGSPEEGFTHQTALFRASPGPAPVRPSGLVTAEPDGLGQAVPTKRRPDEEEGQPYPTHFQRPSPSLALPLMSPSANFRSPGSSGSLASPSLGSNYSPFAPLPSPSQASSYQGSQTFGTPSGYSTSGSSYISGSDISFSPVSYCSSPGGGHFFRLSLDSPGVKGASPRASPRPGMFDLSPIIPSGLPEGPIQLRPILSPDIWDERHREAMRERQRSSDCPQDEDDNAQTFGSRVDEINMEALSKTEDSGKASKSGLGQRRPQSSPTTLSPNSKSAQLAYSSRLAADQSLRAQNLGRRYTISRPSSLSTSTAHQTEEGGSDKLTDDQLVVRLGSIQSAQPLGLGMLAVAASEQSGGGDEEDEAELRARERYLATRRLSLAPTALVEDSMGRGQQES
ncbi:BZ3500_MvSof-1268-A1-R1_Chr1-3g01913 [Microbotryum saponariae]|uniref:BZ3500_MvSof-1268-A1-R1_Chr1-3g01913 protein n=1 Tax=Microbotryum saponariae TaxID=289078 RepID=A0A2X0KPT2_9BASI|nr:BZ3500_MvSof-1268-A1-R1_Chr1-3g01913 [Microbotryum saponariae]SCZ94887.1 BZ3501_MvSof-1269-A2-R1_Chr1-3g01515 [Microbotryum saponariae]